MPNKSGQVKAVFEIPERYLGKRQSDIRIRTETVQSFTAGRTFSRVLDIGCGDGSISLPLLAQATSITLLDLSTAMTSIAQANVPPGLAANVDVRNEDFMTAAFDSGCFDLILCLGVLAYADAPQDFLAKVSALLKPTGFLVLEFTDSRHFIGRLVRMFNRLREIATPPRYHANVLSFASIDQLCARAGLHVVSVFRYDMFPLPNVPVLRRLLHSGGLYRLMRLIFGTCAKNRNAKLGNEYICLLTREAQVLKL